MRRRCSHRAGGRRTPRWSATRRASPRSTSRSATRACSPATRCGCCARRRSRPGDAAGRRCAELGVRRLDARERLRPARARRRGPRPRAARRARWRTKGRPRCWPRSARPRSTCGARRTSRATPAPSRPEAPTEELLATVVTTVVRVRRSRAVAYSRTALIAAPSPARTPTGTGDGRADVLTIHPDRRLLMGGRHGRLGHRERRSDRRRLGGIHRAAGARGLLR